MIPLNKDGSLDIERINALKIEEYTKVINSFTSKQHDYYYSHLPINEDHQQTVGVRFHPIDEVIELGLGVDTDTFLNKMHERYFKR